MSKPGAQWPRHIVWDWNGTLLDDNDAVVAAVNEVCTAFGQEHIDIDRWRTVFSRPLQQCYERVLDRSLSEQDWALIDRLYHEHYRDLLHTSRLAAGVPDELHEWAAGGGTQSLLSMWFHDELLALVREFELDPLFARVDGLRAEVGGGTKEAHLRAHLDGLGLEPGEAVLIGDVVDDAHAAERVGTDCVLLTTGVMSRASLEKTGFPVRDSISEAVREITTGLAA